MRISIRARTFLGMNLLLLVFLTGCATPQTRQLLTSATPLPVATELTQVPFFPQEKYQCGPAALATTLNFAGINVAPDALLPQVYLPKSQGSLQFELLAATRRYGRVPYVLRPHLEALIAEISAGNPVLVLQNLGLDMIPIWHYAVVVGFDLDREWVVLRSGLEPRHVTSLQTFERTWRRGNYWAVVITPLESLPKTADEFQFLAAVLPLEKLQLWQATASAYTSALMRWPTSLGARMGQGNSYYALNDLRAAEAAYRIATQDHPQAAVAFNNLAQTLADQRRWDEAAQAAQHAVTLGGVNSDIFRQTLDMINQNKDATPAVK